MERRTDLISRIIAASPARIYRAMLAPEELAVWLPPKGMTGRFDAFDPREGGTYRMTLAYDATQHDLPGKSSAHADTVQGRFVELVPDRRVVQAVDFESDDPAFAGTMTITWSLAPVPPGTQVTVTCENVPAGIRPEDHDAGMKASLENLSAYLWNQ
jgi:uncharacterized protein YndB with AHSA1/START domain